MADWTGVDPLREAISQFTTLPRKGTPAADLTERERLAVCIAAGAPTRMFTDGQTLVIETAVPCGVTDRGDGGYLVAVGSMRSASDPATLYTCTYEGAPKP